MPVTPDKTKFATGQRIVYVKPLSGGLAIQITRGDFFDWNPVWAADGKSLYFSSNRSGSMNLWKVGIDPRSGRPQGEPRPLSTPASWAGFLDVSTDGRSIIYQAEDNNGAIRVLPFNPAAGTVSGKATDVVSGTRPFRQPDESFDGKMLALQSTAGQEDIWTVNTDGTGLRSVTNDAARDHGPRFGPDGSIVFYSNRGGTGMQLWEVRSDGSGLRRLTNGSTSSLNYPVPSPTGRYIGASSVDGRRHFLFATTDLNREPEALPHLTEAEAYLNDWSPNGDRLAFGALRRGGIGYTYDLKQKRWESLGEAYRPRWLPDGRRLLVLQGDRIVLVDTKNGQRREVYAEPDPNRINSLALSRDGNRLYVGSQSTRSNIWLMRTENASPSQ